MNKWPTNCGFIIPAFNTPSTDYLRCARVLRRSIHRTMPEAPVTLLTDVSVQDDGWDRVIVTPSREDGDWRLSNDSLAYWLSPYERTVKLEADMILPRRVDWWWSALDDRDLNIATTIRDHRGDRSHSHHYRKTFVDSGLPHTYNAMTYYRKSTLGDRFYELVDDIFAHWDIWVSRLKYSSENRPTTDVVYGIASIIVGVEEVTLPHLTDFSMVHMKPAILGTGSADWTHQLTWEIASTGIRIGTYQQMYPVHYWVKHWAGQIEELL